MGHFAVEVEVVGEQVYRRAGGEGEGRGEGGGEGGGEKRCRRGEGRVNGRGKRQEVGRERKRFEILD